jgi:hypothetical protein
MLCTEPAVSVLTRGSWQWLLPFAGSRCIACAVFPPDWIREPKDKP